MEPLLPQPGLEGLANHQRTHVACIWESPHLPVPGVSAHV